jgi:lipid-A-disaccharide synthase-like uncharacterized protein
MDWISKWLWHDGQFLGIEWSFWKIVGWCGNLVFFSRFMVQWYATEKSKRVVVPAVFWWISITGALLLFTYAVHQRDSVFIFAYAFTWIPYIRNLIIGHRHAQAHLECPQCETVCPPQSNFCSACGGKLR